MTELQPILVLTTTANREEADTIAEALVAQHLVAGINLWEIFSVYAWKGDIERHGEWQLMMQSDRAQFDAIEAVVRSLHSYDVPELMAIPIVAGSADYLTWIQGQVSPPSSPLSSP